MKYYSLANILKRNCRYNLIYGERSAGKTYAILEYGLMRYLKTGEQMAIIRRFREDFRGKRGQAYFDTLALNGKGENVIKKLSKGRYDRIIYNSSRWYLAYWDEDTQKNVLNEEPFAYAFALTEMEHDKGNSYMRTTTIFMDEFITRGAYLPDEFILFMNCLSTIIRSRGDESIKIFMAANTVAAGKYNPYFKEMGLNHVDQMKKGDIDVYEFGDSGLRVAVEYTDSPNKRGKPSDVFFAFNNDKLRMITGGSWEIDIHPHLIKDLDKRDIVFSYFIVFEDKILQADIVINDVDKYTYIHEKTTPIKNPDSDVVFELTPNQKHNYYVSLLIPVNDITKKIITFFKANKVFYQSNEVGEIVNQYLNQCTKVNILK